MKIESLPELLLNGPNLHCRPVKNGPVVIAQIIRLEAESTPTFKVEIICPQRRLGGVCGLRDRPGVRGPRRCLWYKGDSHGVYQIIGPGMDKKLMYKQGCQDLYLAPRLRGWRLCAKQGHQDSDLEEGFWRPS